MFNLVNKSVVALIVKGTTGIAVDWVYDHLYWTNNNLYGGCIEVCKLDGSFRIQLVLRSSSSKLFSIAVDPTEGWDTIERLQSSQVVVEFFFSIEFVALRYYFCGLIIYRDVRIIRDMFDQVFFVGWFWDMLFKSANEGSACFYNVKVWAVVAL